MTLEVITFPTSIFPSMQRLVPDVGEGQQLSESPFVGAQSVTTFRGAERWRLELGFEGLTGADRAEMMAFVTRLRVSHNVFLCPNHSAQQRGSFGGTPLVLGTAGAEGQSLVVTGATQNSYWARAGDFVSVNSQLKMVLRDAAATAGQVSSLNVWPPFFESVGSGTPVFTQQNSALGGFRMVRVTDFSTRPPGYISDFTISAVERINSGAVSDFL